MLMLFSLFYLGGKPMAVGLFRPPLDKFAHFATFSLMTALLWVALFRDRPWWLAAIVSCVGAADEIHQIFLPGRTAGVDDFATDVLAAVLTSLLLVWVGGRYQSSANG
jgi:VanZ family protein